MAKTEDQKDVLVEEKPKPSKLKKLTQQKKAASTEAKAALAKKIAEERENHETCMLFDVFHGKMLVKAVTNPNSMTEEVTFYGLKLQSVVENQNKQVFIEPQIVVGDLPQGGSIPGFNGYVKQDESAHGARQSKVYLEAGKYQGNESIYDMNLLYELGFLSQKDLFRYNFLKQWM